MFKVLLIIAAILLAPVLLAIIFGIAALAFKLALIVGVIVLVLLGIKKLTEPSRPSYR